MTEETETCTEETDLIKIFIIDGSFKEKDIVLGNLCIRGECSEGPS